MKACMTGLGNALLPEWPGCRFHVCFRAVAECRRCEKRPRFDAAHSSEKPTKEWGLALDQSSGID